VGYIPGVNVPRVKYPYFLCEVMCDKPPMMRKPVPLAAGATPLAREVHRRMVALGLNQRKLAQQAGLNETYVRDIITGRSRNPRRDQLERLARALGCSIGDLPSGTLPDDSPSSDATHQPSNDPQSVEPVDPAGILPLYPSEVSLIRLWRIIPGDVRDEVLELITRRLPQPPRKR
jgi:transcriptional regulator with XRE-family HTH domain